MGVSLTLRKNNMIPDSKTRHADAEADTNSETLRLAAYSDESDTGKLAGEAEADITSATLRHKPAWAPMQLASMDSRAWRSEIEERDGTVTPPSEDRRVTKRVHVSGGKLVLSGSPRSEPEQPDIENQLAAVFGDLLSRQSSPRPSQDEEEPRSCCCAVVRVLLGLLILWIVIRVVWVGCVCATESSAASETLSTSSTATADTHLPQVVQCGEIECGTRNAPGPDTPDPRAR